MMKGAIMVYGIVLHVWVALQMGHGSSQSECLEEQRWNLLQLKDGLQFSPTYSTKLTKWNQSSDCCKWHGVSCNSEGAVVALDLSDESISDGLDDSAALTRLTSLHTLDLSFNSFTNRQIPSSIHKLTSLTFLNLTSTNLTGPINESLTNLPLLAQLHLKNNHFLTPIPRFFANFTNMKVLNLRNSSWIGEFPEAIFRMGSLEILQVSDNKELAGKLPEFNINTSLEQIIVRGTKFGGIIPDSIWNLPLINLKLGDCQFEGKIPMSVFNKSELYVLELQNNNLTGLVELDWIGNLPKLYSLSLSLNLLTVKANSLSLDQLKYLELNRCNMTKFPLLSNQSILQILDLSDNHLEGSIPSSLPTTLAMLNLGTNNFTSSVPDYVGTKLTSLLFLQLEKNSFNGEIPSSLCNVHRLNLLSLSSNSFHGLIPGCIFENLTDLIKFDVDHNQLSGSIPDTFQEGCMIQSFSLSYNLLGGQIPKSLAKCKIFELDLSNNNIFDTFPCHLKGLSGLGRLFLHNNKLQGDVNCIGDWPNLQMMVLMNNNFTRFTAFRNSTSTARLKSLFYLILRWNNFEGTIPSALCNISSIEQADFGFNHFHGSIPECLPRDLTSLRVLNLENSFISGSIPNEFHDSCAIQSLYLRKNDIEGSIPQSLAKCSELKVLDVSNNRMGGLFPCHLKSLPNLKVLSLRSNFFRGGAECIRSEKGDWDSLRIIDISKNQFGGVLPPDSFVTWNAAITDDNGDYGGILDASWSKDYGFYTSLPIYYNNGVGVTSKGSDVYLVQTLGIFSMIDFSDNQFHGQIPESIGLLSAVRSINLSHNSFTGAIPLSIGNLSQLESLDLSNNLLSGNIPPQFVNLRFLQRLNVSMNNLDGRIPTGTQLQSFPASSYQGNEGLYGPPLTDSCSGNGNLSGEACKTPVWAAQRRTKPEEPVKWLLESAAIGFVFGLSMLLGSLILVKSWRMRCSHIIHYYFL